MFPTRSRSHAFTLLELAVSLGVLTILATVTVVSIQRVRVNANALSCRNNLSQQGRLLIDFVSTHTVYPLSSNKDPKYSDHKSVWYSTIGATDRAGNFGFICPSAISFPDPGRQVFQHYGYNDRGVVGKYEDLPLGLGGNGEWPNRPPPVSEASIQAPGAMIAILDAAQSWNGLVEDGTTSFSGRYFYTRGSIDGNTRMLVRHRGSVQILFCDGHVGSEPVSQVYVDNSPRGLAMWNRDASPHLERVR